MRDIFSAKITIASRVVFLYINFTVAFSGISSMWITIKCFMYHLRLLRTFIVDVSCLQAIFIRYVWCMRRKKRQLFMSKQLKLWRRWTFFFFFFPKSLSVKLISITWFHLFVHVMFNCVCKYSLWCSKCIFKLSDIGRSGFVTDNVDFDLI